ncbi:MAG: acyl-CoA dehydrogenase family protein [Anaerolineales bacterium]|nr:acyl-CoA dehydrogenase family protein [Anaerolineales bacterium]
MSKYPPYTEEHEMFRRSVRAFAEREIAPHSEQWDTERRFPDELFRKAAQLGCFGLRFAEKYGGLGLDYWYVGIMIEELMRARNVGVVVGLLIQCEMATNVIHKYGSEDLKQEFLAPAIAGERIAALGVTEPNAGSDVAAIRTTARREGSDYVINGQKTLITNALRADFVTLAVRTGDPGPGGVSVILVPTDAPGFSRGRELKHTIVPSSDMAELFFENCRVPTRNLVGEEGKGFYYIMDLFQGERLVLAYIINGLVGEMIQEALNYMHERSAFGKKLAEMQVWRHRFADVLTEWEASKMLAYRATDLLNKGDREADTAVSMARLFAADFIRRAATECVQVFGGYGLMDEYWIARAVIGVHGFGVGAGTQEVQREIIAKRLIG